MFWCCLAIYCYCYTEGGGGGGRRFVGVASRTQSCCVEAICYYFSIIPFWRCCCRFVPYIACVGIYYNNNYYYY
jgi:hypothetical protein